MLTGLRLRVLPTLKLQSTGALFNDAALIGTLCLRMVEVNSCSKCGSIRKRSLMLA